MRKNAKEVLNFWLKGKALNRGSISTDGIYVKSYKLPIAVRNGDKSVVILNGDKSPSKTTTTHIRACYEFCLNVKEINYDNIIL